MMLARFIIITVIGTLVCACTASLPAEPTSPAPLTRLVIHYPIRGTKAVVGFNDGSSPQFEAYAIDSDDLWARVTSEATWTSSDTVALSPSTTTPGLFFYRTAGSYVIYANYRGLQGTLPIEVRASPSFPFLELSSIANFSPSIFLRFGPGPGNSQNFTGPQVTWSSSDERIATVNARGNFQGVAPGNVRIAGTLEGFSDFYWRSVPPRGQ